MKESHEMKMQLSWLCGHSSSPVIWNVFPSLAPLRLVLSPRQFSLWLRKRAAQTGIWLKFSYLKQITNMDMELSPKDSQNQKKKGALAPIQLVRRTTFDVMITPRKPRIAPTRQMRQTAALHGVNKLRCAPMMNMWTIPATQKIITTDKCVQNPRVTGFIRKSPKKIWNINKDT